MPEQTNPFCLLSQGYARATAYVFSNKSVTIGSKTHVVWLDAVSEIKGRTLDHNMKNYSDSGY